MLAIIAGYAVSSPTSRRRSAGVRVRFGRKTVAATWSDASVNGDVKRIDAGWRGAYNASSATRCCAAIFRTQTVRSGEPRSDQAGENLFGVVDLAVARLALYNAALFAPPDAQEGTHAVTCWLACWMRRHHAPCRAACFIEKEWRQAVITIKCLLLARQLGCRRGHRFA